MLCAIASNIASTNMFALPRLKNRRNERQDPENDNYGRRRMYEALRLRKEEQHLAIDIPSERTVYR
ncbi:MAG: hypothetical protein IJ849_07690, partial [Selenomonadaceae bacterium]|nr:hypothetical protein [Selenomonadaceae bacterium]